MPRTLISVAEVPPKTRLVIRIAKMATPARATKEISPRNKRDELQVEWAGLLISLVLCSACGGVCPGPGGPVGCSAVLSKRVAPPGPGTVDNKRTDAVLAEVGREVVDLRSPTTPNQLLDQLTCRSICGGGGSCFSNTCVHLGISEWPQNTETVQC